MSLAENIRFLRKKLGLSQDELAEKLGYKSYTTVQKWESGVADPPLKSLGKMSKLFGVDMDAMAGDALKVEDEYFGDVIESISEQMHCNLSRQEEEHLDHYRKLSDENRIRVDRLTITLLDAQSAEDEILLAAHREREFNQEAHEHDMKILDELDD